MFALPDVLILVRIHGADLEVPQSISDYAILELCSETVDWREIRESLSSFPL